MKAHYFLPALAASRPCSGPLHIRGLLQASVPLPRHSPGQPLLQCQLGAKGCCTGCISAVRQNKVVLCCSQTKKGSVFLQSDKTGSWFLAVWQNKVVYSCSLTKQGSALPCRWSLQKVVPRQDMSSLQWDSIRRLKKELKEVFPAWHPWSAKGLVIR